VPDEVVLFAVAQPAGLQPGRAVGGILIDAGLFYVLLPVKNREIIDISGKK
jgi:hypothetical protein